MTSDERPGNVPDLFRGLLDRLCGHRRRWSDHETQVKTPLEQRADAPQQNGRVENAAPQIPEIAGLEISRDRSQERELVTEEELDAVSAVSEGIVRDNVARSSASADVVSVASSKDEELKERERKSTEAKHRREESWQNRGMGIGKKDWATERAEADSREVTKPLPALPMAGVDEGKEEDDDVDQEEKATDPKVEKTDTELSKGEQAPWNKTIESSDHVFQGAEMQPETKEQLTAEQALLRMIATARSPAQTVDMAKSTPEPKSEPAVRSAEVPPEEAPAVQQAPQHRKLSLDEVDVAAGAALPDSRDSSIDEEELIPARHHHPSGPPKETKELQADTPIETRKGISEAHTPVMEATSGPLMDYYAQ